MADGDIYERCSHRKVKEVSNDDWSWFECVKCGYRIPDNQEEKYLKVR